MNSNSHANMARALELAALGAGNVAPNPLVGCVITARDQIIGEGFHARFGEAHAEVNAINSVKARELLSESTLYVTLEPCNHTGKTPPCTKLIAESGIRNVVVAVKDPNPLVSGSGIRFLETAGINVTCGLFEQEATFLNRRFFTFHRLGRPYIILRWAESSDGYCDPVRKDDQRVSLPVSGSISRQKSHQWRTEEQAILVGAQTVIHDNPSLLPRLWPGKPPLRILFDPHLRIPQDSKLFQDGNGCLVFNHIREDTSAGVEYRYVEPGGDLMEKMLKEMQRRMVLSVMVEGGPETISRFFEAGQWDEIRRFRSTLSIHEGVKAPAINLLPDITSASGNDYLDIFFRKSL